jgi:hypothetical protein
MSQDERPLPPGLNRFNYWEFAITHPGHLISSQYTTVLTNHSAHDRLSQHVILEGKGRAVAISRTAAHQFFRSQFYLHLNASRRVWEKDVAPFLDVSLAPSRDRVHDVIDGDQSRIFFALKYYVEHDKQWKQDGDAREVFNQLTNNERTAINALDKKKWGRGSTLTGEEQWHNLLRTIACDQEVFLAMCQRRLKSADRDGTQRHLYQCYSNQAIKLLGGGTSVHKRYLKEFKKAGHLDDRGRFPSKSIFAINWRQLSSQESQRQAKAQTLHWFNHALRNLREYRYNRHPIPWTLECAEKCRRVQEKLSVK